MLKLQLMHCNPRENSAFVPGTGYGYGTGNCSVTSYLNVSAVDRLIDCFHILVLFGKSTGH